MGSGHGVPKPNKANHPNRQVGPPRREDYHTNTVADAARFERNNAPSHPDDDIDYHDYGYDDD